MRDVYDGAESIGTWVIANWPKLQKAQLAKLDAKLDMLRRAEVDPITRMVNLPANTLAGPGYDGHQWIYKLKVKGNVALRPMVCLGPLDLEAEWTVLARAVERDNLLDPLDVAATAEARRKEIVAGTRSRRKRDAKP